MGSDKWNVASGWNQNKTFTQSRKRDIQVWSRAVEPKYIEFN